jgi:hypothetical protein
VEHLGMHFLLYTRLHILCLHLIEAPELTLH